MPLLFLLLPYRKCIILLLDGVQEQLWQTIFVSLGHTKT
jgi:hypothetical protein